MMGSASTPTVWNRVTIAFQRIARRARIWLNSATTIAPKKPMMPSSSFQIATLAVPSCSSIRTHAGRRSPWMRYSLVSFASASSSRCASWLAPTTFASWRCIVRVTIHAPTVSMRVIFERSRSEIGPSSSSRCGRSPIRASVNRPEKRTSAPSAPSFVSKSAQTAMTRATLDYLPGHGKRIGRACGRLRSWPAVGARL